MNIELYHGLSTILKGITIVKADLSIEGNFIVVDISKDGSDVLGAWIKVTLTPQSSSQSLFPVETI